MAAAPAARLPNNKFPPIARNAIGAPRVHAQPFVARPETRCPRMHPRPLLPSPPCWSSQLCNSDEPAGRSCPATMAKACLAAADQGQISVDSQLPDGLRFPPQARAIAALIAIHPSGWCQSLPRSWSHSPPLLRGRSEGGRSGPGGHRSARAGMERTPPAAFGGCYDL